MMEVNPRATLWMGLTRATGVDVPYLAYRDLVRADAESYSQEDGVRWIYLPRDVQSAWHYFVNGQLSLKTWFRLVRNCREEAIVATDDWMTAGCIPLYAARRLLRYLR